VRQEKTAYLTQSVSTICAQYDPNKLGPGKRFFVIALIEENVRVPPIIKKEKPTCALKEEEEEEEEEEDRRGRYQRQPKAEVTVPNRHTLCHFVFKRRGRSPDIKGRKARQD
jgi:hypothetical protein